jgi:hypothetical protein
MACAFCGSAEPTREATLYQNIGMIAVFRHATLKGPFCRGCMEHYFWRYTLVTGALGWWGIISFVLTPLMLVNNLIQWLLTLRATALRPAQGTSLIDTAPRSSTLCPRCLTPHPGAVAPGRAVWASLVVCALLLVWSVSLLVGISQHRTDPSNFWVVLAFAAIIGGTLVSFAMLLRHPLRQCAACGHRWPE